MTGNRTDTATLACAQTSYCQSTDSNPAFFSHGSLAADNGNGTRLPSLASIPATGAMHEVTEVIPATLQDGDGFCSLPMHRKPVCSMSMIAVRLC